MQKNVLIVDDDPVQTKVYEKFIAGMGYHTNIMHSGRQAIDFFVSKKPINDIVASNIDIVLLDLYMPDVGGLEVLEKIDSIKGDTEVIVLTSSDDVRKAVAAMSLGAFDYIVKGKRDVFSRIIASINNALDKRRCDDLLRFMF